MTTTNAVAARERGILFSAPMVRALLAGTKTQTRRVLGKHAALLDPKWPLHAAPESAALLARCPYGRPGDRLWVRETWQGPLVDDQADLSHIDWRALQVPAHCVYAADGGPPPEFTDADDNTRCCWRPSIHMPRWASRITLEITGVRVERLQDISDADAIAEGIEQLPSPHPATPLWRDYLPGHDSTISPRHSYETLWEQINGPGSWDANPWVWCVSFRRVEVPHG